MQARAQETAADQARVALAQAVAAGDHAAMRDSLTRYELLTDNGILAQNATPMASYALMAEVASLLGDLQRTAGYYEQSLQAAAREGHWQSPVGLRLRGELASTYLALEDTEKARRHAQALIDDLDKLGQLDTTLALRNLETLALSDLLEDRWASAEQSFHRLLQRAERRGGAEDVLFRGLSGLSEALLAQGRLREALPAMQRATGLAMGLYGGQSEELLLSRVRLGATLQQIGDLAGARQVLETALQEAGRAFGPGHQAVIRAWAVLSDIQTLEQGGSSASVWADNRAVGSGASSSGPTDLLEQLNARADAAQARGDHDGYEALLTQVLDLVRREPTLDASHAGIALLKLARFQIDHRGSFDDAFPMLEGARILLNRHLGPDHVETLRAEVEFVHLRRLEAETENLWRPTGRQPVFWDGTQADAAVSDRDLDLFARLTRAEFDAQSGTGAYLAALNYASLLSDAGRLDETIRFLGTLQQHLDREEGQGAAELHAIIVQELGEAQFKAGNSLASVQTYQAGVPKVLAHLQASGFLSASHPNAPFQIMGQLYGQNYATAAWRAAVADGADQGGYFAHAFEAAQLAGYGPATAAAFRSGVQRAFTGPDMADLAQRWQSLTRGETPGAQDDLDAFFIEMRRRRPDLDLFQVPRPVPLARVQGQAGALTSGGMVGEDEALIMILPNLGLSLEEGGIHGLVLAVTQDDIAWAELPLDFQQLTFDIGHLHEALDPGRSAAVQNAGLRAPLSAIEGAAPSREPDIRFDYPAANRLYQAFFGAPDVARVIADKPDWIIVPAGVTMSVPFAALTMDRSVYPGDGKTGLQRLREARWLGLEKGLTVVPSISALEKLRQHAARPSKADQLAYIGFGDPDFAGLPESVLVAQNDLLRRSGEALQQGLRALPKLPGTRREIETMADFFMADHPVTRLGGQATETELRQLQQRGDLQKARILHFATHGLLSGALDDLAEPALALTPEGGAGASDGLLTASEVAELEMTADWVILSACDTAGPGGLTGAGLGGLVQGFFNAGAANLLVSHWRVDDVAAERLATHTVIRAEGGLSKSQALRQAMRALQQDQSRDGLDLPFAHPALWAPFMLVGAGG